MFNLTHSWVFNFARIFCNWIDYITNNSISNSILIRKQIHEYKLLAQGCLNDLILNNTLRGLSGNIVGMEVGLNRCPKDFVGPPYHIW